MVRYNALAMPTVRVPDLSLSRGLRADASLHLAASGVLALAVGAAIGYAGGLGPGFVLTAAGLCLLGAILLLALLPGRLSGPRFGKANGVTATRAALTCVLAAALGAAPWNAAMAWSLVGLAASALALDGFDGWLARHYRESSRFGARFDMETDAFFLLTLAALVAVIGKVGPWILLAGLWRYGFVAAALLWPALRRPLPESGRRKLAFVAQAVLLIVCLAPSIEPALATALAAAGLAMLSGSFLLDLAWLIRHRSAGGTQ